MLVHRQRMLRMVRRSFCGGSGEKLQKFGNSLGVKNGIDGISGVRALEMARSRLKLDLVFSFAFQQVYVRCNVNVLLIVIFC